MDILVFITNFVKYKTKQTIKIYWQHIKKYGLFTFIIFITSTVTPIVDVVVPIYLKKFFDFLAGGPTPQIIKSLIGVVIAIAVLKLIQWTFRRLGGFSFVFLQTKIMADLDNTCFRRLHQHSFSFFNNNFVGSLVKKVTRFVNSFESLTDKIFFSFSYLFITTALILVVLFSRNVWLGLGMFAWVIVTLALNSFFSKYKYKYDLASSEADSANTAILADTITNHINVKLFCGYGREVDAFAESADQVRKFKAKSWNLMEIFFAINSFLMIMLEVGIMYFALILWHRGLITIGDFALIQAYILSVMDGVWQFGHLIQKTYEDFANAEEMTEILLTPQEIVDVRNAKALAIERGAVEFKEVDFCYNATRYILRNFELSIKPREKIALVGPSGAGKTTVARLLLRMHDVSKGKILIDGQKVSKVTQESLWQTVGLVPQEPMLFHRSLFENIRYGRPEATAKEVIEAAKMAHCHDFISAFPDGYETRVGERGVKLSGGERQRVAIARAILYNAPILILDEATSSLDSESEHLIQAALDNLMKEKTVIVVAHRLSTIMKMDRIIVMDEGRITEQGSHAALLKNKNGLYYRLWQIQAGGFID